MTNGSTAVRGADAEGSQQSGSARELAMSDTTKWPTDVEKETFQRASVEVVLLSGDAPPTWSVDELQKLRNGQRGLYLFGESDPIRVFRLCC